MSISNEITVQNGVFFITFTCTRWIPLFRLTDGYATVYQWFNWLRSQGHYIIAYVVMPNHVHAIIAFHTTTIPINTIIANGKRFMAYGLVKRLKEQNNVEMLEQLSGLVNRTESKRNKQHEIFEPSFDRKECRTIDFMKQKADYIHFNPCRKKLAVLPEEYEHSSARYYFTGVQGVYPVVTYMELQDIDLET
jgi:REP element-mobilizing transposase RayT